jgi:diguanylate cyclase (GGDEF)-like protein
VEVSVAVVGDCVGEMSVLDGRPATASVVAEIDSLVLVLPSDLIWNLIDHTTYVSRNLLHVLSGRLRLGDRVISANQDEKARIQRIATQDLVTGLRNRRWFDNELNRLYGEFLKTDVGFSLIMFDVDHFNSFNQRFGLKAGDVILQRTARAVAQAAGERGVAARYARDEFMILVPNLSLAETTRIAESMRFAVERLPECVFEGHLLPAVTISAGVACLEDGMTATDLIEKVDTAVHAAKSRGRNRVVATS